ncbi:hypothetical protein [Parafrankia discariae]|nr:hypothetical protein [Parafrankia discariae]
MRAGMPVVMDPPLTTRETARVAAVVLPGARCDGSCSGGTS